MVVPPHVHVSSNTSALDYKQKQFLWAPKDNVLKWISCGHPLTQTNTIYTCTCSIICLCFAKQREINTFRNSKDATTFTTLYSRILPDLTVILNWHTKITPKVNGLEAYLILQIKQDFLVSSVNNFITQSPGCLRLNVRKKHTFNATKALTTKVERLNIVCYKHFFCSWKDVPSWPFISTNYPLFQLNFFFSLLRLTFRLHNHSLHQSVHSLYTLWWRLRLCSRNVSLSKEKKKLSWNKG